MRANIHPEYSEITVTCSCGNKFITSSALCKNLNIEVCNACHPFYTGKQRIMDTAGRVEKFRGKFAGFALNRKEDTEGNTSATAAVAPEQKTKPAPTAATTKPAPGKTPAKTAGKAGGKPAGDKKSK